MAALCREGRLPESWVHNKLDALNIKSIHKKFGSEKIKSFPIKNYFVGKFQKKILGLKVINILNYINYDKAEAKKLIQSHFKWRDYGGKHYESVFTRFYQAYILPKKFDIDKRKSHYSTLICAGQLTRSEALKLMKKPTYESAFIEKTDLEFFLKKLDFTSEYFKNYIKTPKVEHTYYKSIVNFMKLLSRCKRIILFRYL